MHVLKIVKTMNPRQASAGYAPARSTELKDLLLLGALNSRM
jgi:hypothetical protein